MAPINVRVKWGKKHLSNIDIDTDLEPSVFRNTLFKVTGVHPSRQRILIKGVVVKDSWENVSILPDSVVLLMGSKEELPAEPETGPLFLEDMSESELTKACNLPPGLINLGNTCYVNAIIQCLRTVPELKLALKHIKASSFNSVSKQSILLSLRDQFELMDKGVVSTPLGVIHSLHIICPHFSEKDANGNWKQQDANECWLQILNVLQETLEFSLKQENLRSFVYEYFSGTFEIEYRCAESDTEPLVKNEETFLQLSCFISQDVKFMQIGLQSKLVEEVTKHSITLNRDAVFQKVCKINRLPTYLTIQFVRFFYKEKEKLNTKILKEVQFPIYFDAYDLCSEGLKKTLTKVREQKGGKLESTNQEISEPIDNFSFFSNENDKDSNNSGLYQLYAVVTHKGRSSTSGHYVAWINQNDMWFKCDDSDITLVKEKDILRLSGGGDSHCAYILLYGPRILNT